MLYLFLALAFNFLFKVLGDCPVVKRPYDQILGGQKTLRLVQYNVEWMFLDHYEYFDCPGAQCTWKNLSEAQTHMSYVAKVINELKPDILNLCEVEGCDELNALNAQLSQPMSYYLKQGTDISTGQNVALITRISPRVDLYRNESTVAYPVSGSKCRYTGEAGKTGVSKHYITEFSLGGIEMTKATRSVAKGVIKTSASEFLNIAFIAAHLLAIPTDPARCAQREAQATVLRSVVDEYLKQNYEVIVIGDMNDYDAEILDVKGSVPTSRVLDILKGVGTDHELTNLANFVPQKQRFSDWWDSDNNCTTTSINDYSMIDHILVTPNLVKYVKDVFVYHGYGEFCGKWNSDHYPLVVDFEW